MPGAIVAVDEHAQDPEQFGRVLDFVDDDKASEWGESFHRRRQCAPAGGIFEIEVVGVPRRQELASHGGFAALPWPDQNNGAGAHQGLLDAAAKFGSVDHAWMVRQKP